FDRAVEGLITIDTPYDQSLPFPVVAVSGHHRRDGVTNIELNHDRASELALTRPGPSRDRIYQGTELQFGHGYSMGFDQEGRAAAGNSSQAGADNATRG